MTEIVGHDDAYDPAAAGVARVGRSGRLDDAPLVELLGDDGEPSDDDSLEAAEPSRGRAVFAALVEPASLSVAAALSVLASVMVGPSFRFAAYPFNLGLSSLKSLLGTAGVGIHPLRSYLSGVAPAALLILVALGAGLLSLLRSREPQPAWVRAVGAGAVVVALVLAALVVAGAWQASTLDLKPPVNTFSST